MTKLVEVALPLEAISVASRRDKDRKVGSIKNVHKWFAPMPTPAWRALLFASLVDDPGDGDERKKLLHLIERLVPEHGGAPDNDTLAEARKVLQEATGGNPPIIFDPFCGGGSTLVEAQRLGLPAAGSDLNPVPVLITRVLTELVPQVQGRTALVGDPKQLKGLQGSPLEGFLADCRHYAERVREQVWNEIGHLYPDPPGGGTVIAWLWARTVVCPNPVCRAVAPLMSSFWLSKKKGFETWLEPMDAKPGAAVRFEVRTGAGGPSHAKGTMARTAARCLTCEQPIPLDHVRFEGRAGRMSVQLMAVAVDQADGRRYLDPLKAVTTAPTITRPPGTIDLEMPEQALGFRIQLYGMTNYADLFTNRQLVVLGAFAGAVAQVPEWVRADGGDEIYARASATVLGLCVGKLATFNSTQGRWWTRNGPSKIQPAFTRHALPMVWDFGEANPFGGSVGDWLRQVGSLSVGLSALPTQSQHAHVYQADARQPVRLTTPALLATDPPYFAQIGYADLSDYFYVWLRRALSSTEPDLFATVATPKATELIAAPYRHGGSKQAATDYFVSGFTEAFHNLAAACTVDLPMLVVYAHRQEESSDDGSLGSTAWTAMLTAILSAGLKIVGTWPIHATTSGRQIGIGTNSLASYVVLVCRTQDPNAKVIDRQGFLSALRADLPRAIRKLQEGAISSIDLGQATIGPGMAIFSRFARVIEPSGEAMTVDDAIHLIGSVQGEVLNDFVGDLDGPTRWAMDWYRAHGFDFAPFDDAEKVFKTTNTSLDGLVKAGIIESRGGKVRLLAREELTANWSPDEDQDVTVWEVTQHLVRLLTVGGGEDAAAALLKRARRWSDEARNLAYWLSLNVARSRPKEALDYDALVTSWPEIARRAEREPTRESGTTGSMFTEDS